MLGLPEFYLCVSMQYLTQPSHVWHKSDYLLQHVHICNGDYTRLRMLKDDRPVNVCNIDQYIQYIQYKMHIYKITQYAISNTVHIQHSKWRYQLATFSACTKLAFAHQC